MSTHHCDDCYFKILNNKKDSNTTNRKKAIISDNFVKYGDKIIRLNDIIVYTRISKESKYYRRVRNIYTNRGNVYIDAGLNSFSEMLFDDIEVVNLQDLSTIDILKMLTCEIRWDLDFDNNLVEIYKNIMDKKYNIDNSVDRNDSENTYAGLTKDELQALGWFLIYKSTHM